MYATAAILFCTVKRSKYKQLNENEITIQDQYEKENHPQASKTDFSFYTELFKL